MSVEDKVRVPGGVSAIRAVPRSVVALGLVSLFMDISSEIIHSLLPVFLVAVLGASALSVGFIEGIAEAASQVSKLFAGAISDWVGKRKPLVLIGYGLVWGFSCQVVIFGFLAILCSERECRSSSRRLRSGSRSARKGSRDRNA